MEYVSSKIKPINSDLAQLFAEMEQSYELLKKTSDATTTMCKQNMVTMRECHENLINWMRTEIGFSDSEIYEAAENRASGKVDERIDTYEIILALADEGYVSEALEKKMHRVRMLGNDAAHYSAIDNGRPNALRGKSPEQVMELCDEMYETLIEIARQVVELAPDFKADSISIPKFSTMKKKHESSDSKNGVKAFFTATFWIVVAVLSVVFFTNHASAPKDPRQEAQEAITAQFSNVNNFQTAIGPWAEEHGDTRSGVLASIERFYKDEKNAILNASIIELTKYEYYNFNGRYQGQFDLECVSSNPSVASVDWTGRVVAEGPGYAYVRVVNWGTDFAVYHAIIHVK